MVVELDVVTGRRKEIANEPNWRRTGIDPQGRLRLALEQNGKRFRYLYRAEDGRSWVPLDSLVRVSSNPFFPYLLGRIDGKIPGR